MTPEQARLLFEFNQWANQRTLDACAPLSAEQFTRDLGSSFRSVRDTLAHLYGAEWIWHERFHGRSHPALPSADGFPDLAVLRAKFAEIDNQLIEYVAKLSAADLEHVFHYTATNGKEFNDPHWQMLQHLANHGSYHRGQVATLLRQLGTKPTSTDLIAFYRTRSSGAHA